MVAQVLVQESSKYTLPKLPVDSHYSVKPMASIKPSRALPSVPNGKLQNSVDNGNGKHSRALPRAPKPVNTKKESNGTYTRTTLIPLNESHRGDEHTSGSSGTSTPREKRKVRKLPVLPPQKPKEMNRVEALNEFCRKEGEAHMEKGKYEEAVKSFNMALRYVTDDKVTIVLRSRAFQKLGKIRKATQDSDLALKLDPLYHEALLQKGELLLAAGEYENAMQHFQMGARTRPDREDFQDRINETKSRIAETHKGVRKRKNIPSPDEGNTVTHIKEKGKKKKSKAHQDANSSHSGSSHMEEDEVPTTITPLFEPHPPPNPPPPVRRQGRQMTPLPTRLQVRSKYQAYEKTPHPRDKLAEAPKLEDVNDGTMKNILGRMYNDKEYLERLVTEAGNLPQNSVDLKSLGEKGLNFLYDRVSYWVEEGHIVPPAEKPAPPRERKGSSAKKEKYSSKESLLEESENVENTPPKKTKRKKPSTNNHTFFRYLEQKKAQEAQDRKENNHVFLHVVEGQKISPRDHSDLDTKRSNSKEKQETTKKGRKVTLSKENKDFGSKESINLTFKTYRVPSDLDLHRGRRGTPMDIEDEDSPRKKAPKEGLRKLMKKDRKAREEEERKRQALADAVKKDLEDVEIAYADGKFDLCIMKAQQCLEAIETKDFLNKPQSVSSFHSFLGNAYMAKKDYETGLKHHQIDLDIGQKNNLQESISRALGNLGRIYVIQKNYQEALNVFLQKTPLCKNRIETAWLFHQIGNCFLALGDFEYAKDAAKKSLEAAETAVEWSYQLQSCVLMGVAEVKLKQYHAAFNTFERALEQARLQGDEQAEEAVREALMDVNERIQEDMRGKGNFDHPGVLRAEQLSRSTVSEDYNSSLARQGLTRSRLEIMKMHEQVGYRNRADYAKPRGDMSDYSSIYIPDDDGTISLTETVYDHDILQLDLERLKTNSTLFGSQFDTRDSVHTDRFISAHKK
ncbi:hypothetical protein CHS0354_020799 [Potamilus streckersoni]|uniref:Outer dynein arm-docking complex subunit 4 n=1 Tax=Potamilus streckersoni TaxID=2493646 RepID=A0AAE0RRG3_9BIVA|nr:hypothetical protein CHS0354_020799 [Potamilus streckersoni]